jgi:thioredoxin 1
MSNVVAVTTADFEKEVLQSPVPVLVDFWAVWCGPCRQVAPSVDAIAEEFSGKAKVFKVDVDNEGDLAIRYGIMSIPALLYFKDGKLADQLIGAYPKKDIVEHLQRLLD